MIEKENKEERPRLKHYGVIRLFNGKEHYESFLAYEFNFYHKYNVLVFIFEGSVRSFSLNTVLLILDMDLKPEIVYRKI